MIIVSSCLCGINCRYDGSNNLDTRLLKLLKEGKALPVCPEQLGGLATPREPCEILNGNGLDVIDGKATIIGTKNNDLTSSFLKGAYETLKIAEKIGATTAILKARSPSCGVSKIYDGTFSGTLRPGNGVTAELLLSKGIKVFTEEDLDDIKL
ncbi:DUF523 domain-containing protein [Clostridium estertheticum]|uniref:DUF523 domain-containing protein n=1 Tax=Clostridium estertheticum TaxID=238834 RepID=A0AA47EK03_9CLOT|nr:DUF523 domain-containing protein [Clostridium estertheticum]MBU3153616.1 DUF523 domain-containing protein [Clostridium estertheticum]MBU3198969.1 DUF523 domain-containing protein [Clostridium estertheticum]WAG61591.1 DUF523 domain-containing protein [Clostridium estertheticum]WAG64278.1 DUF523 domain-containing protein [Clostridium estertheticum]